MKVIGIDNMNGYYDVRLKEAQLESYTAFMFIKGSIADKALWTTCSRHTSPQ